MNTEHLVRMANQIGAFFDAMPDHEEAVEGVAQHLNKFWEPRMRKAFLEHVDGRAREHADDGLAPIVAEAVRVHRQLLD